MQVNTILQGDALAMLRTLPPESVQCVVTSPPYYGLRDYGAAGQIGLEETPAAYVAKLVEVFREVRRVLKDDGTLWLNLGDTYANSTRQTGRNDGGYGCASSNFHGMAKEYTKTKVKTKISLKPKNLLGIPWRVAFALQDDGWILRSDIIWHKNNPMPESVTDRPTKSHEYLFLLAKSERYYYCADAIREAAPLRTGNDGTFARKNGKSTHLIIPGQGHAIHRDDRNDRVPPGRNKRTVWTIATYPYPGAHFAVMPPNLVEPCILAGSRPGDVVLDPFSGSGTVAMVSVQAGRQYLGIELNPTYIELARKRLSTVQVDLWQAMTPAASTIASLLPASEEREEQVG